MATLYKRKRRRLKFPGSETIFPELQLGGVTGSMGGNTWDRMKQFKSWMNSNPNADDQQIQSYANSLGFTKSKGFLGDLVGGIGDAVKKVSPALSFIPGVGPLAAAGIRFGGNFLSNKYGDGARQRELQQAPQYNSMQYNPMMSQGFGGGFGGGFNPMQMFGGFGALASLFSNIAGVEGGRQQVPGFAGGWFPKGGPIRKYQKGGLIDIQAEKGEFVLHPTGYLTPVHAKETHKKMDKMGDGDMVTDHLLEGSFIFSDYLKLNKSDADEMVVGIKRYPYKEGEKGKEPEVYSVGDIFNRKERKKTPAKLAKRVSDIWKVTNDKNDIFNILGDKLNIQNRIPYLQGISNLSELERQKDDMMEAVENMDYKKGGKARKYKRGYKKQYGGILFQSGGGLFQGENEWDRGNPYYVEQTLPEATITAPRWLQNIPQLPTDVYNIQNNRLPIGISDNMWDSTRMTMPDLDSLPTNDPSDIFGDLYNDYLGNRTADDVINNTPAPDYQNTQYTTQMVDMGNPTMRGIGQGAMYTGMATNFLGNVAGAIGSYNLNNNLINENPAFYDEQRGYVNRGRNMASFGNLFDAGIGLMQQGPVDQEERFSSRVRQFRPRRADFARLAGRDALGQINTMIRNNPNSRGLNIGSAISANNQAIAQAQMADQNQQLQINQMLDEEDYFNQNVRTGNQQRTIDFGNSLIQGLRPSLQGYFSNESGRQYDLSALNRGQRQDDISFRQNRLHQPIQYLTTAGNSLSNAGSALYSLGTNYQPMQVPVNNGGGGNDILGTIGGLAELGEKFGLFGKKGGRIKKRK